MPVADRSGRRSRTPRDVRVWRCGVESPMLVETGVFAMFRVLSVETWLMSEATSYRRACLEAGIAVQVFVSFHVRFSSR